MHDHKSKDLTQILDKDFATLNNYEVVFLLLFVVYRFRNNIFHGNKGVQSWLRFQTEIEKCIEVMQVLISAAKITQNQVAGGF